MFEVKSFTTKHVSNKLHLMKVRPWLSWEWTARKPIKWENPTGQPRGLFTIRQSQSKGRNNGIKIGDNERSKSRISMFTNLSLLHRRSIS